MKRNCNNCKALQKNYSGVGCHCQFNHNIEITKEIYGLPVSYKPLEKCEKPITNKEWAKHFSKLNRL